jgi:heme-degrading monooxygenase HmoA
MSVRVMVSGSIHRPEDIPAFEAAFTQVSKNVRGTPGHIKDELLRDAEDPLTFILLGEWKSKEEFLSWEESPVHRQVTAPMRPYWKYSGERKLFDVAVRPAG